MQKKEKSVPCVLSMLVSALYNIVDQIFIGQSIGYLGNAATIVGFLFTDHLLSLFGVTEASYDYARNYMRIILLGIPFYVFSSGMNGAIRADGSPGYSMVATVIGAVLNLILDPIAIFVFDMGVEGAAIATVIGQVVSCIITVLYFRKSKTFRLCKSSFKLEGRVSKKICLFGISSFITQLAIVIIISVANVVVGLIAMLIFELFPQSVILLFGNESSLYNEYAALCFRVFLGGILLCCI